MTRIPAVYRDGVFVPEISVPIANETTVEVLISDADLTAVALPTSGERLKHRQAATATMKLRSLSAGAPRFSRDELHERT